MTSTSPTVEHRPSQPPSGRRSVSRRWALVAVALGTFMTYLDNNIINVAIPTIQRDLGLTSSGIEWVVSAYILLFAGLLLAGGRIADVFGRKRVFVIGLSIFTVASLAAGLSGSMETLIASRALQGLGAALLTPTTLAILTTAFPEPKEQAGAVGAWSAVGALALAVGPLLGGVLVEDVSWHWIFFVNVPVGVLTLLLGLWAIAPDPAVVGPRRSLDLPGIVTSAVALVAVAYGLIEGPQVGWGRPAVISAFALFAVAAAVFVAIERRTADPMLDVSLFTNRIFNGGVAALMMWAFGLFGIYFFTSLYLQNVLGFSALKAGVAFVPMAILMAGSATVSDWVATCVGAHRSVAAGMLLMALGIAGTSLLGSSASFIDLMPGFVVIGLGGGLTIPLTSTVLGFMPEDRAGIASAVFNASREVAGLLGITIIGVVLSARRAAEVHSGHTAGAAFLSGYRLGLVVAAVLVAAGGLSAWAALRRIVATTSSPATSLPELLPRTA